MRPRFPASLQMMNRPSWSVRHEPKANLYPPAPAQPLVLTPHERDKMPELTPHGAEMNHFHKVLPKACQAPLSLAFYRQEYCSGPLKILNIQVLKVLSVMDRTTIQKTNKEKEDFQNRINQLTMLHRHLRENSIQQQKNTYSSQVHTEHSQKKT